MFDSENKKSVFCNDGKLEYESIGFVDDGFDIEYSLPN